MKYHKQLYRHDPANGIYGDCYRTAIACLLDKAPSEVPHFLEGNPDTDEFHQRAKDYLETQGLITMFLPYQGDLDSVMAWVGSNNKEVCYILSGTSPRGFCHAVICKGNHFEHDPHPDGTYLTGPCSDGYYWVELLVKKS